MSYHKRILGSFLNNSGNKLQILIDMEYFEYKPFEFNKLDMLAILKEYELQIKKSSEKCIKEGDYLIYSGDDEEENYLDEDGNYTGTIYNEYD